MKEEYPCAGPECDPAMKACIKFDDRGLIPAVVQDIQTREVLMLAYMNKQSLEITCRDGLATFWSRSRGKLWTKGGSSGNVLEVRAIDMDCDGDALILHVEPAGPACHTGRRTCFYRTLAPRRK